MTCPRCGYEINWSKIIPGAVYYCRYPNNCWYSEMEKMTERDPLLEERQKTHGDFELNARYSQELKRIFRHAALQQPNHPLAQHAEALDMIALKLSRILSGQANFKDHWDDIAGYAKLGSEACEK